MMPYLSIVMPVYGVENYISTVIEMSHRDEDI